MVDLFGLLKGTFNCLLQRLVLFEHLRFYTLKGNKLSVHRPSPDFVILFVNFCYTIYLSLEDLLFSHGYDECYSLSLKC